MSGVGVLAAGGFTGRRAAMTDLGLSLADWIGLCRSAMSERGLTMREVDELAGLGEGYVAKIMCGQVKASTWRTVERVSRALGIKLYAHCEALTP
jgi:hypothetical protein